MVTTAGRIQGITVEIGGDTSKLSDALKSVNSQIKNTQSQLKDVEKLLKLDPGNTELLAQKHRLLGDAVAETKEKLATLKAAAEQANDALARGEISQEQYDGLQREIAETEQALERLEQQANESATAVQKIAATGEDMKKLGGKITEAGEAIMPASAAVTALGVAAVKTASDFDSAMSQVAAVSGATGEDLDALRDKAREMGSKTKFSASEAAEAMNYMAMAGWKTSDMLSGIEGIMNLAAASGESLGATSDIVTDALTAFGLTAADSAHFADILAAASSNANTNVSMMGETFKYCAPIAGSLGFSAEDTAEAIGLMANSGIKSTQAGTALRTIMTSLAGEVKICGSSIGEVTIATSNADGTMRELSDILADCRVAFAGLSEAEQASAAEALVGKNAMSGFLALINAAPADIDKLSSAIANCDGKSLEMAETMQDNLGGQLTILKSALEELAISFGELLMPAIRGIVEGLQSFVNWLNSLGDGTKTVIVTIGLFVAALGPVLIVVGKIISAVGTIMTIVPKLSGAITAVKTAFAALNTTMLANPIFLIIAAITALVAAFVYLWNNCEGFREFWINLWDTIKSVAVAAWEGIKSFFTATWEAIKQVAVSVWEGIKSFFSNIWDGIKSIFNAALGIIKSVITNYFNAYKAVVETVFNIIKTVITTAWEAIKGVFTTALNLIKNHIMTVFNVIKTVIQNAMTTIQTIITTVWTAIQSVITTILTAIQTVFSTIWNAIKSVVQSIVSAIKSLIIGDFEGVKASITSIMNTIRSTMSSIWNTISSTVSSVVNTIKNTATNVFNAMKDGISNTITGVYNTVRDGFNQAVSYIKNLASEAFSWGADLIQGIVNGIKSCIGKVKDAVCNVADTIRSYLHFSVPDVGPLTDYESWMPDFMSGLAKGINDSKALVQKAVSGVAADMVISPQMARLQMAGMDVTAPTQESSVSGLLTGLQDMMKNLPTGGNITIPVYLGSTLLDEVIVDAQNRQNLRSGGR